MPRCRGAEVPKCRSVEAPKRTSFAFKGWHQLCLGADFYAACRGAEVLHPLLVVPEGGVCLRIPCLRIPPQKQCHASARAQFCFPASTIFCHPNENPASQLQNQYWNGQWVRRALTIHWNGQWVGLLGGRASGGNQKPGRRVFGGNRVCIYVFIYENLCVYVAVK